MSHISECPVTESAWNQRSVVKACSPPGNYHCVRTQDDGIRELCTHPIWMQAGKCPYYNKAGRLDSSNCRRRRTLKCPTAVYISNRVFKYPSCFPEKREVTTDLDKSLPTSFVQRNITLPVSHGPEESGGDNSALAALILLVLPVVLAIVIFWKRKEIYMWINNKQKRRQKMTSKKGSTDTPLVKKRHGHDDDIEEGNREKEILLDNPEKTINEMKEKKRHGHDGDIEEGNREKKTMLDNPEKTVNETKGTLPSAFNESQRLEKKRNLIHLDVPKLSFVDNLAKELKTKELVIITGLPGSGKTELAHQIVQALTNIITTNEKMANFQHVHDLKNLDFVEVEDKLIFLIFDHCIKSWFSKTVIDDMLEKLETPIKKTKGMVHALMCVPDILLEACKSSLKSSSLENKIYNLKDGKIYKDGDWKAIFDSHLKSKKEMIKSLKYKETDIDAWRKSFIKIKATNIGKPTLAKLLFEDANNFQNVPNFLQNTYKCVLNRISALSESTCVSKRRHFVVLVMLMLNNGQLNIDEVNKDTLAYICNSFDVEDVNLFEQLEYPEIVQNAKIVTVHCRETVRLTFDVLWKKRKDLVIKYCDDMLFLERASLTERMTDQELIALNDRFQYIFQSVKGKFHVMDHNVASKCSEKVKKIATQQNADLNE